MQPIYRGIPYTPASASTLTVDSGLDAIYRGVRYSVRQAHAVTTLPAKTLKYRGTSIGAPEADWHPAFCPTSVQPAL